MTVLARRLAAVAVLILVTIGPAAAVADAGDSASKVSGTRTTPTLTGSFPLGARRLSGGGGAVNRTRAVTTRRPASAAGTPARRPARAGHGLELLVVLLVVLGLLLALGLALRRRVAARPPVTSVWSASPLPRAPRPRRPVSVPLIRLLVPVMRYSAFRDAYVLRLVGRRIGPVLVVRPVREPPAPSPGRERIGPMPRSDPSSVPSRAQHR